jgi:hypothetical protein
MAHSTAMGGHPGAVDDMLFISTGTQPQRSHRDGRRDILLHIRKTIKDLFNYYYASGCGLGPQCLPAAATVLRSVRS